MGYWIMLDRQYILYIYLHIQTVFWMMMFLMQVSLSCEDRKSMSLCSSEIDKTDTVFF